MLILWIATPMIIVGTIFTLFSEYKRNSYLKTTKLYLKNIVFFRIQNEILSNPSLDDETLKQKLSCIIEQSIANDKNLEYKVLITLSKNKKIIKVNISNGIRKPFNSINENLTINLSKN